MVICLERSAELYMAQLMPLPLTVSASVKSRLVLPFRYRITWVVADKGPLNVSVCVCVCVVLTSYGDSVENSSVFSLIRMHWLLSARACGQ